MARAASQNCRMDQRMIAKRIDGLLSAMGDEDKKINDGVAAAILVSGEAVRQWRKGDAMPRLNKLQPLSDYLMQRKIQASPQFILFGSHPNEQISDVKLRERIASDEDELTLLLLFRACSPAGQNLILQSAKAYQQAYPQPHNVVSLRSSKRRRR